MAYQDAWIRGRVGASGDRSCEDRYAVIRSLVQPYTRPITVWDLGANLGYFGCRLAEEFACHAVMVESRPALVEVCQQNALPSTVAMTHRVSAEDLGELAASEHADLVLALNVLHHMPDWSEALDAILALGEDVIIETPGRGDVRSAHYARAQAILDAIEALDLELLATTPSHVTPGVRRPLYRSRQAKPAVAAGYAYRGRVRRRGPHPVREHRIESSLIAKTVQFAGEAPRPWAPGINLWNWAQMGGSYPTRSVVDRAVREAYGSLRAPHGDFRPWNLILQGDHVAVIDAGHRQSCADAIGLVETVSWIADPPLAWGRCA